MSLPIDAASAAPTLAAHAIAARFDVSIISSIADALAIAAREAPNGAPTPFQGGAWLTAWRDAFAHERSGVEPIIVVARARDASRDDANKRGANADHTGALAMILPLARRRCDGLVIIAAFDAGVTDYNAPILGPAAPTDAAGAQSLWRAVKRALPPADLIEIGKSPRRCGDRVNPLSLVGAATASTLSGNILDIDAPFDDFVRGFERKFRKELGREKRVFEAIPGALFESITDPVRAEVVLDELSRMQAARIRALGREYRLDDPDAVAFYRSLLREGLARGETTLTALIIGDEVVAALLGVVTGDHYAMVRLGQAGAPWSHFSPGRLVIMETMRALRTRGLRRFDFTIGDYDYKRRLGVAPVPLVDLIEAASWRGLPRALLARARAAARQSPTIRRIATRLRSSQAKS